MKANHKLIFALLICIISTTEILAQVGYGQRYGTRRGSDITEVQRRPEAPEPLTADELVDLEMPKITEALKLDEFEQAVVRSILTKYTQQRIELGILELEPEKLRESLEKIHENQQADLKSGLTPEKYDEFLALQEKGYKKFKSKRRKKQKN